MLRCRIGLALGSGAAKGLAHIGVLKAFEEAGLCISAIAGSSIGAVVGGAYAAGRSVKELIDFANKFGARNRALWIDPSFFMRGGGMIKGNKIEDALREFIGPIAFGELKIPFAAIATDLYTGKEVVLKEGDLNSALHASFSVPGIFAPVRIKEHLLVDGGVIAPVPTRALQDMKCDIIVGVNVAFASKDHRDRFENDSPGVVEVLLQVLSVAQKRMTHHCMELADVHISPDVAEFGWTDFSKADELIERGYIAAKRHMPIIKGMAASNRVVSYLKGVFGR